MDVLSDVFGAVRLTGAIFFDIHARAPWVAETPPMTAIGPQVMPDFDRVISFHVLIEGRCFAQLSDRSEPAALLEAGDSVLFPAGDPHSMGSEEGRRAKPDHAMYFRPKDRPLPFVFDEFGGNGESAHFVCGYLGCDARPFNPILDALPRTLHVRRESGDRSLTADLIRVALREKAEPRAGGETILARLSELMFLQAVRQHVDALPADAKGWLAGLRDLHVGAALRLMHGRPADPWTLETVSREIGMSRSVFAERFTQVMGMPAMQYLSSWRLQLAARLLERPNLSITQAAAAVGYESEAAFNRAFKKQVGTPPGAWRRARFASRDASPVA